MRPEEIKGARTVDNDALDALIEINESVEKNPRLADMIFVDKVEM